MTDNEIFETGALCEALLSSMQFTTIVQQYEQTIAADILATKPEEKARREELYASLWGSRGLLEFMKLNADAAATIKDKANTPIRTTEAVEDYDDEGFSVHTDESDY